jgi:drug/metabolite transporter (DMT)-like permease
VTGAALALVLLSAVLHAAWNRAGRGARLDAAGYAWAAIAAAVVLAPIILVFPTRIAAWPTWVWPLLGLSAACQAVSLLALAVAYRAAAFSVAYPLTRALPLVLTAAWVAATVSLGRTPIAPFACIAVGCALLAFSAPGGEQMSRAAIAWSVGIAILIAAYSLLDDHIVRGLSAHGDSADVAVFAAVEAGVVGLGCLAVAACRRGERTEPPRGRRLALGIGAGMGVSYLLVLLAMPLAAHVGWVLAFRQASIPLGAAAAILLDREPAPPAKLAALTLITAGLAWAALA